MTSDSPTTTHRAALHARALACGMALFLGVAATAAAADAFVRATIDRSGQLHIFTKRRREILPKRDSDQVGFEAPRIAPDGRAVGWLALYPNTATTYPIPLKLVIQAGDTVRTLTGTGLPIWRWDFQDDGRRAAFEQETVHGGIGVHYELWDIETGKLIAQYEPAPDSKGDAKPPKWVAELDSGR